MTIAVEGRVDAICTTGRKFAVCVTFPPTIGGKEGANIVSVFISESQARAYVKHGIGDMKVTLTIEEPPVEDEP